MNREIFIIGLNHRSSDVEVREAFALSDPEAMERCFPPIPSCSQLRARSEYGSEYGSEHGTEYGPEHANEALPVDAPTGRAQDFTAFSRSCPVHESLILSTCNRVELAVVGKDEEAVEYMIKRWAEARGKTPEELRHYIYIHKGPEAVRHIFTVASSLDSLVLGEPQILGQLKEAYRKAVSGNQTKVILNRLLHKAFSVAKRVRTETAVASSAVSISYAAVELAKRIFGGMSNYTAMLIGAGEMAELAATHLINAGVGKILVTNRTFERAEELAKQFRGVAGEAVPFEKLTERLPEADIVISSTGSQETIIKAKNIKDVLKTRKQRPMFFIDIAVPRDIDPDVNNLDNVYLYDIDDLKDVVEENLAQRREEAARARTIVDEESKTFCNWIKSLDLQPTIVDLLRRTDKMAQEELNRTLKRLGPVDDETREALQTMLQSIVKKFNHEPITFLKRRFEEEEAGARYLDITRRMFNLDEEEAPPAEAHNDRKRSVV